MQYLPSQPGWLTFGTRILCKAGSKLATKPPLIKSKTCSRAVPFTFVRTFRLPGSRIFRPYDGQCPSEPEQTYFRGQRHPQTKERISDHALQFCDGSSLHATTLDMDSGIVDGNVVTFDDEGKPSIVASFKGGKPSGPLIQFLPKWEMALYVEARDEKCSCGSDLLCCLNGKEAVLIRLLREHSEEETHVLAGIFDDGNIVEPHEGVRAYACNQGLLASVIL